MGLRGMERKEYCAYQILQFVDSCGCHISCNCSSHAHLAFDQSINFVMVYSEIPFRHDMLQKHADCMQSHLVLQAFEIEPVLLQAVDVIKSTSLKHSTALMECN